MKLQDSITHQDLLTLANEECEACLSLYMPMVESGREARQNQIRFKTLCQDAERRLKLYGLNDRAIAPIFAPLEKIQDDRNFWRDRAPGLAIFIGRDSTTVYRLPIEVPAEAVVDKRFYIRPLLPLADPAGTLPVLLIGTDGIGFYRCNKYQCDALIPPDYLKTMDDFLKFHDFEESLQHSTSRQAPHYHAQGVAGDDAIDNRYREVYFRQVKNWLAEESQMQAQETLYLVGDDRSTGLFSKVAADLPQSQKTLIARHIDSIEDEAVMKAICRELEARRQQKIEEEWAQFKSLQDHEPQKALIKASAIVAAAHDKRIDTLFLPPEDNKLWGTYDVEKHCAALEKDEGGTVGEELFNLAAIRTLQNGGHVVVNPRIAERHSAAICHW